MNRPAGRGLECMLGLARIGEDERTSCQPVVSQRTILKVADRFRNSTLMTGESTGGRHWLGLALVMPNDDDFGAPRNGLGILGIRFLMR